jgi:maltodextrin utilization protein YvdJ
MERIMIDITYPYVNSATYNVNTIVDKPTNTTRHKIIKNILTLKRKAVIIGLQQTRLPHKDNGSLNQVAVNTTITMTQRKINGKR